MKNKRMSQNCGQKKIVFGDPKENEARKAFRKGNEGCRKGGFRTSHLNRAQAVMFINTRARAKIKKEKAREVPIHRQDLQLLNIPLKRSMVLSGNQAIGTPVALTILQRVRGTIQDTRLGWRQFPWILPTIRPTLFAILVAHDQLNRERQSAGSRNMRCIMVLRQNSVTAISLLSFPTLGQKLVGKVVSFILRQNPPCSTRVDVLETGDVLILCSLPQMQNLSSTVCCAIRCFFFSRKKWPFLLRQMVLVPLPWCIIWCLHAFPTKTEKKCFWW